MEYLKNPYKTAPHKTAKVAFAAGVLATIFTGGAIACESRTRNRNSTPSLPKTTEFSMKYPLNEPGQISINGTVFEYPKSELRAIEMTPISNKELDPAKAEKEAIEQAKIIEATIGKPVIVDFTHAEGISSALPKLDTRKQNAPVIYRDRKGQYAFLSEGLKTVNFQYKPGVMITEKGDVITNVPILTEDEGNQTKPIAYFDAETEKLVYLNPDASVQIKEGRMFVIDKRK